jgi:uncharacterized membrane protein YhaH (DUF805 family)
MLPLDVSNMTGFGGGIDMKTFWLVVYITTAAFVLIIIPIFTFYYEADEGWTVCEKIKYSFCYLIIAIIVIVVILVILYSFIGDV